MHIPRALLAALLLLAAFTHTPADPTLHHAVNLGNALESPHEGDWGVVLQPDYFPTIHNAGFDTVRVPIRWTTHIGPAPAYTIDPAFFQRIDWVVAQSEQNHLNTILDYHNDPDLMKDPDAYADRYIAIWKQVAGHYQAGPDSILFELMNEPNGKLDSAHWNALIVRALAVIRPTNPTRTVVVGPVQWNSFDKLPELNLPEDDHHLLATFHYYLPMQFTHQGASWVQGSQAWLGTKWEGTDAQRAIIARDFGAAADWARAHQRPLFLGEFGADSRGDIASRARWISSCARTAESLGIPYSYWEFCAADFGAYDPVAHHWRQPILNALVPPAGK
jgi:endoglucanase